jgi:hypothetical protein
VRTFLLAVAVVGTSSFFVVLSSVGICIEYMGPYGRKAARRSSSVALNGRLRIMSRLAWLGTAADTFSLTSEGAGLVELFL